MTDVNTQNSAMPETISDDVLRGADEIAQFLGLSRRSVYYFVERGELPVFRLGNTLCARRSTLLRHIEILEAACTRIGVARFITGLDLNNQGGHNDEGI